MMIRQGDVFLVSCKDIPKGLKPVAKDNLRVVLAYGEVTGHHHSFGDDCDVALLEGESGERFLQVENTASLEHQEHDAIEIPAGNYRVIIQREYSPEAIKRVVD
jgi:hypothetical protein